MPDSPSDIVVYGAFWCPDCRRSKQFLGEHLIPYGWVNIEEDADAQRRIIEINDGKRIIPTIVFADGSILVEPSNAELAAKIGAEDHCQPPSLPGDRHRWRPCRSDSSSLPGTRGHRHAHHRARCLRRTSRGHRKVGQSARLPRRRLMAAIFRRGCGRRLNGSALNCSRPRMSPEFTAMTTITASTRRPATCTTHRFC